MLNRLFWFLGYQYAKIQFFNDTDQIQDLTQFFSKSKNVLVALPIGYEQANQASNALRAYRDQLHHLHLTVINNATRMTSLIDFPKCEVIRIDPIDINRFHLPSKSLMNRILQREYDVAMDFNLDFVLYSAYICKASRAKVRVGLAHSQADIFFNVQLNFSTQRSSQELYEKFAEYLTMF